VVLQEEGLVLSRIRRLPEDLVNKIAAGEVVERPASVAKELLENALDAGARSIVVEVEGGGKGRLRVRDDGEGMSREDAVQALERHATSKLRELADLERVGTHGFRGEALPSIASVSHLVLRTSDGGEAGTEVEVRHGRLVQVRDAGHPRGTSVDVRDLFGAVPARRKFLRADATESAHLAEAVTLLALTRPDVGFRLVSGNRETLSAPPVDGLAARLYQVFGEACLDDLLAVDGLEGWVGVRGFVARPDRPAAARPSFRLYVNGRAVRDRALARAVAEAYRAVGRRDPGGQAFLFVEVPLHMVDVNVHPAKTEIRFADPRTVWGAVERVVKGALAGGTQAVRRAAVLDATERFLDGAARVAEPSRPWPAPAPSAAPAALPVPAAAAPLVEAAPPTVLGQHRNTYILASDGEDLLLIDQHTAHERVRFEALVTRLGATGVESQLLLVPAVHRLAPRLQPVLEVHQDRLGELGFEVESFGGDSVRLRAVPALLAGRDPGPALEALLRDLLERDDAEWAVSAARDRVAATLACHSAARAGEPLALETQRAIVAGLWRAAHPAVCPHGRPTRVRIPREDVTRWFQRTGWRRQ
jgi:DNA mismatch repair protein MutL